MLLLSREARLERAKRATLLLLIVRVGAELLSRGATTRQSNHNVFHVVYQSLSRVIPYSSLRGPPRVYAARARSARVWWDGRVGRVDGWTGRTVDQKCPLIFFILCRYIDKIYIYLKQNGKKNQHSYGFQKFDVKLVSWFFFFNFTLCTCFFEKSY